MQPSLWEKCKENFGCFMMIIAVVAGILIWRNWPEGPFPGENRDLVNANEMGRLWSSHDPSYAAIDQHALAAPPEAANSVSALARYLCPPDSSEVAKARAVFCWITRYISYSHAYVLKHAPDEVLRNLRCDCKGYARLFHALARQAGLEVSFVAGKSYSPGSKSVGGHIWNAVKLEGRWYLLDCTWGAGYSDGRGQFVQEFRPFFFLTPPEHLIFCHLPDNANNQLLADPIPREAWSLWPAVPWTLLDCGVDAKELRAALAAKDFEAVVGAQGNIVPPPRIHKLSLGKYFGKGDEVEFEIEAPGCRCEVNFQQVNEIDGRFKGKMKCNYAGPWTIRIQHKSGTRHHFDYVAESAYNREIRRFKADLERVPNTANAFYRRGYALVLHQNDYFKGIRDFDEALRLDPKLEGVQYYRAIAQFMQNAPEAVESFQKILEREGWQGGASQDAVILGYLAARRAGDPKRAERFLQDSKGKLDASWPTPVVSFLGKETNEAALLKEASTDAHRTDAHTYLGLYELLNDKKSSALEHFRRAQQTDSAKRTSYWIAQAESRRLASAVPAEPPPAAVLKKDKDKNDGLWDGRNLDEWIEIARATKDVQKRIRAISAISNLQSQAKDVDGGKSVEALFAMLNDPEPDVRMAILRTITSARAKDFVPAIAKCLDDPDASVRIAALESLYFDWANDLPLADKVLPLLTHPKEGVRLAAARSLGNIKNPSESVVQAMGEAVRDADHWVADVAMTTLEKLGNNTKPAAKSLVEALSGKSANMRMRSRSLLLTVKPPLMEQFPTLAKLMKDRRPDVRCSAICVLEQCCGSEKETLTIIGNALADADASVRSDAAMALGRLAPSTRPWLNKLGDCLEDEDAEVRRFAAFAIGKFGADAKDLVPNLVKSLEDKGYRVRLNAAVALGKIGPAAQAAIPKLTEIQPVCPEAAKALKQIQGKENRS